MVAATWSEQFDLRDQIEGALGELAAKEYDDVSPVAILQVLAAYSGDSANRQAILDLRTKEAVKLTSTMTEIREALKRATDFLVNDVYVKSSDFLPYERQLVALAFVFAKKKKLTPQDITILRQWFWRTSFSERYRRGGEGLFDEDLATVLSALVDSTQLNRFGKPPAANDLLASEFRKTSALSNAFVALLASQSPRNLVNGSAIDTGKALSSYNRKEFHHIFPQAYLREFVASKTLINSLPNICMLSAEQNKLISDRKPSDYFQELEKSLGTDFITVLKSNLIPESALPYLTKDDFGNFLTVRSQHIANLVNTLA